MSLRPFNELEPTLGAGAWVAPSADVIGDVRLGIDSEARLVVEHHAQVHVAHRDVGVLGAERELVTGVVLKGTMIYRKFVRQWEDAETNANWGGQMLGLHVAEVGFTNATRVAGVAIVFLVLRLVSGHNDISGVDDDNIITGVNVGREFWLVLAAQTTCDFAGHTTEDFALGVNHVPVTLDFMRLGHKGLHDGS